LENRLVKIEQNHTIASARVAHSKETLCQANSDPVTLSINYCVSTWRHLRNWKLLTGNFKRSWGQV